MPMVSWKGGRVGNACCVEVITHTNSNSNTQLHLKSRAAPPSRGRAGNPPPSGFERGLRAPQLKKRKCRSLQAHMERKNKRRMHKRERIQLQRYLLPQHFTNTRTEAWAYPGPDNSIITKKLALQTAPTTTTHTERKQQF